MYPKYVYKTDFSSGKGGCTQPYAVLAVTGVDICVFKMVTKVIVALVREAMGYFTEQNILQ